MYFWQGFYTPNIDVEVNPPIRKGVRDSVWVKTKIKNKKEAINAIKIALCEADLDPLSVEYVNAHGSSTPLNDEIETVIIKKVFNDYAYKLPISSNKSMLGHSLGAAGAIEVIASVLTIEDSFIPPTINYQHPDPQCDLNYVPNRGINKEVNTVLSNSFAFGSRNAAVVIKKYNNNR